MKAFERTGGFLKKSWINDLVSSPSFAKDLTSIYADDIIQAVTEDNEFPTLEAAITDLRSRVGFSDNEANEIRKVAAIKINPKLYVAMQNIPTFSKDKLAALIAAYTSVCDKCTHAPCDCGAALDPAVKQAVDELSIERIATLHDECAEERAEDKADHKEVVEELEDVEDKVKKHEKKEAEASVACEVTTAGKIPEGLQKWMDKKNGNKPKEEGETSKNEDDKKDDEKVEKEASLNKKSKGAADMSLDKKANAKKWLDYFKKQSWFQGAEEPSHEGKITSNDPNKLGYPGDIQYDRKPMETQVGGDSRDWEQKWFEGAADKTKKVMGPSGEELKEKKEWLRAKWDAYLKKTSSSK